MASAITVFNEIVTLDEELANILQEPFYFDARGQQLQEYPAVQKVPICIWFEGSLIGLYKRPYIELAQRFKYVPPLSNRQIEALD